MNIIDGKLVSNEILMSIKEKIEKNNLSIGLGIIMIGNNEASNIYVNHKLKMCDKVGVKSYLYKLDDCVSEEEVFGLIDKINKDENIHGLIVQSPTPEHIDFKKCVSKINNLKDIDGLGMSNTYDNYLNNEAILPCTVKGIIKLLEYYKIDVMSKDVVIIGKGNLVGKPLSLALLNLGATVTVCHSKTNDLKSKCKSADIIISATGCSKIINSDFIKEGATVIDVGITRDNGKLSGDVDNTGLENRNIHITPVPGGVGPMTVACLISNTVDAYERIING